MYILLLREARLQAILHLHNRVAILLLLAFVSANSQSMTNISMSV